MLGLFITNVRAHDAAVTAARVAVVGIIGPLGIRTRALRFNVLPSLMRRFKDGRMKRSRASDLTLQY